MSNSTVIYSGSSPDRMFLKLCLEGHFDEMTAATIHEQVLPNCRTSEDFLSRIVEKGYLRPEQADRLKNLRIGHLDFGEYEIVAKIGAGGMGDVYLAMQKELKRKVAIKVLPPRMLLENNSLPRFEREIDALVRLSHPNIVTILNAGKIATLSFYVMEFVDGVSLSQKVISEGALNYKLAVDCIIQAARALAYAHGLGIIHRDVKPGNLLIDESNHVKLLDLGLVLLQDSTGSEALSNTIPPDVADKELTRTGSVLGSVYFISPEQAAGPHNVDERSDIYSLGCTFYYLLTGNPPFVRDSIAEVLVAHQTTELPPLPSHIPRPVAEIYYLMMAKSPEDRYQSMQELISDLSNFRKAIDVFPDSALVNHTMWREQPINGLRHYTKFDPTIKRLNKQLRNAEDALKRNTEEAAIAHFQSVIESLEDRLAMAEESIRRGSSEEAVHYYESQLQELRERLEAEGDITLLRSQLEESRRELNECRQQLSTYKYELDRGKLEIASMERLLQKSQSTEAAGNLVVTQSPLTLSELQAGGDPGRSGSSQRVSAELRDLREQVSAYRKALAKFENDRQRSPRPKDNAGRAKLIFSNTLDRVLIVIGLAAAILLVGLTLFAAIVDRL